MDPNKKHETLFPGSQGFQLHWDNLARGSARHSDKLGLPSHVTESPDKHNDRIATRFATPWRSYKRRYDIELDTSVIVCQKIPITSEYFGIRRVNDPVAIQRLQILDGIKWFLHCSEIFAVDNVVYTVSEYADISLKEIVCCPPHLDESQLASIIF